MKKSSLIILALFLFAVISSLQPVLSQEKTKEEKEKELQIQEELVKLKKELTDEQKAAQDEVQRANEERQKADKASKEVIVKVEKGNNYNGGFRNSSGQRGNRPWEFDDPFGFYSPNIGGPNRALGEGERSSWDFSKSVKESSFSRDYVFDVEKSAKTVVMSVTGDCKTGEIRIKIVMPNGKTYSDIVVDESGNLNWRKSFNISEEENKDKAGEWKYEISASKATGFFKISLQTF